MQNPTKYIVGYIYISIKSERKKESWFVKQSIYVHDCCCRGVLLEQNKWEAGAEDQIHVFGGHSEAGGGVLWLTGGYYRWDHW